MGSRLAGPCILAALAVVLPGPAAAALPTRVELATVGPDGAEWVVDTDGPATVAVRVTGPGGEVPVAVDAVKGRYFRARAAGLEPGREYGVTVRVDGIAVPASDAAPASFRTLEAPPGDLLFRFATVTDTHVGEDVAGLVGGLGYEGFSWPDPDKPYWRFTNEAAVQQINASGVDFVIHKGDLTAEARPAELVDAKALFDGLAVPWHAVRGNHDRIRDGVDAWAATLGLERPWRTLDFRGHRFLLLDTSAPETGAAWMGEEQVAWAEGELVAARAALRPTWIVGHHPLCEEAGPLYAVLGDALYRMQDAVDAASPVVAGSLAGHSHRNVRLDAMMAPGVPFVETSSTKEYPGMWTEVRVFEGGWMQIARVIDCPECREWYAITTGQYGGSAPQMQFGRLQDRCFTVAFDPSLVAVPPEVAGEDVAAEDVAAEDVAGDVPIPDPGPDPGPGKSGGSCAAGTGASPAGVLALVALAAILAGRAGRRRPGASGQAGA